MLSKEDKILIKKYCDKKRGMVWRTACRIPDKHWPLTTVKRLQRTITHLSDWVIINGDVGHTAAYRRTRSPGRLAFSEGLWPSGAGLHSSDELSQWLVSWWQHHTHCPCIIIIIIIIIIINDLALKLWCHTCGWQWHVSQCVARSTPTCRRRSESDGLPVWWRRCHSTTRGRGTSTKTLIL